MSQKRGEDYFIFSSVTSLSGNDLVTVTAPYIMFGQVNYFIIPTLRKQAD